MPSARQKQGTGWAGKSHPGQQKSRPARNMQTEREESCATRAYGFGGVVVEAGFGAVEAAGRLAAGLGVAADAFAG